jgi:uncharacterized membrane protein YkoI
MGALAHAASALETATGGKVLEIRLANTAGEPAFEAAILRDPDVLYMRIQAPDEHVTQIDVSDLPPWLIDFHLEAYGRTASKARVPLDEAIVSAEARALAPAVDAGIAKPIGGTNAVPAYFVQTAKGGRQQLLAVDAQTGAFIANPDELYAAHKPVDLARRLASAE